METTSSVATARFSSPGRQQMVLPSIWSNRSCPWINAVDHFNQQFGAKCLLAMFPPSLNGIVGSRPQTRTARYSLSQRALRWLFDSKSHPRSRALSPRNYSNGAGVPTKPEFFTCNHSGSAKSRSKPAARKAVPCLRPAKSWRNKQDKKPVFDPSPSLSRGRAGKQGFRARRGVTTRTDRSIF